MEEPSQVISNQRNQDRKNRVKFEQKQNPKLVEQRWLRITVTLLLAISSIWFLTNALYDFSFFPSQFPLFDESSKLVIRIVLGTAGVVATIFQAYYWSKSLSEKKMVKVAINHYVRNRIQYLLLAIELYNADPTPKNLGMLTQARAECEELIKEVDLIVDEKLKAPLSFSQLGNS